MAAGELTARSGESSDIAAGIVGDGGIGTWLSASFFSLSTTARMSMLMMSICARSSDSILSIFVSIIPSICLTNWLRRVWALANHWLKDIL